MVDLKKFLLGEPLHLDGIPAVKPKIYNGETGRETRAKQKKKVAKLNREKLKNPWTYSCFGRVRNGGIFRQNKNFWRKTSDKSAQKMLAAHHFGACLVFYPAEHVMSFFSELRISPTPEEMAKILSQQNETREFTQVRAPEQ